MKFEAFNKEGLEININSSSKPDEVLVNFSGKINVKDPQSLLGGYLGQLHNSMVENKIKLAELDFTKLEYVNSSAFKVIFKWFMTNHQLPEQNRYIFKLKYKKSVSWQMISFDNIERVFNYFIKNPV